MKCWEYMKCGREQGGVNSNELGVCPAWPDYGDCCIAIAGTLCKGEVQGTFARKVKNCLNCNFYRSGHCNRRKVEEIRNSRV